MTQTHFIPDERTVGRVVEVDKSRPPSERITAAQAAVAAQEHANDNDAERVALHDHYGTRDIAPLPARRSAGEPHARARLLALVRERARQLARDRTR